MRRYGGAFDDVLGGDFEDGYNDGLNGNKDRYMAGNNSNEYNRGYRDGASGKQGNPIFGAANSEIIDMAGALLQRMYRPRPRGIEQRFTTRNVVDTTAFSFTPSKYHVLGAAEGMYPFYDAVRNEYRTAMGTPRLVRVDTQETYAVFRAKRRQPYLDSLDSRLARLHTVMAQAGYDERDPVAAFEAYCDGRRETPPEYERELVGAIADTVCGGRRILGRQGIEGWVDGDEVLVSARTAAGVVTAGAPFEHEFRRAVLGAEQHGCQGAEALIVGSHVAPRLVGLSLLEDFRKLVPHLNDATPEDADGRGYTLLGVLAPKGDVDFSSAMFMLQCAQRGNRQALRDSYAMAHNGHDALMGKASRALEKAQREQASRWS